VQSLIKIPDTLTHPTSIAAKQIKCIIILVQLKYLVGDKPLNTDKPEAIGEADQKSTEVWSKDQAAFSK
jgi:hypothetical protein